MQAKRNGVVLAKVLKAIRVSLSVQAKRECHVARPFYFFKYSPIVTNGPVYVKCDKI